MRKLNDITRFLLLMLFVGLTAQAALAQNQPLPLGSELPRQGDTYQTADGTQARLGDLAGAGGTVVMFYSNNCPWVDKYEGRVTALINQYKSRGVNFILVNPNDPSAFPKESLQENQKRARALGAAYLADPSGTLAAALGAERTNQSYFFDANKTLVYVGTIDDSPGDPGNVQKQYLRDAIDAVLGGAAVALAQTKPYGCMLKLAQ